MPIIETRVVDPVSSEANLTNQTYTALIQRYKTLTQDPGGDRAETATDLLYHEKVFDIGASRAWNLIIY